MIESSPLPALAIAVPLLGAALIAALGSKPNLRECVSVALALATLGLVASMLPGTTDGRVASTTLLELSPGINIALRADPAGMLFATLASFLWVPTAVYSIGYMRGLEEEKQTRFFAAFALSVGATLGVALAANLLTFVLFYELLTLFTYPLVIHRESDEAVRAGRKYLLYTLGGGLALIGGTAWLALLGIDTTFSEAGVLGSLAGRDGTVWALFVLLTVGVVVKAAVMPLHSWLPAAMVAPTPVSALLHAVAVVKAGVFGVVRVLIFVFGVDLLRDTGAWQVLAIGAAATVVLASLLALRHDNLKRRLAYSTVSHLSYIVLGVALLGPLALTGALLHLVGHGVTKITLFFCAGAIHVRTHRENVSELDGIGKQMPVTMAAFALASLSMAGIPPFVLFASKWYLGAGAVDASATPFLFVYIVSGVLSAGYLFPIVARAFWQSSPSFTWSGWPGEASLKMVVPLAVTGLLALIWGLVPNLPFSFLSLASQVADRAGGGA
ncbi:MAG: proton-conducting transporter membrane subunit [Chloroflexota bacterium]|nr:proton-conducting transporter membrane subunit [Chloroflexota bacterium]MDE2684050.1 proton-conducting transporter membrane subunit [Chloroflexota bacterium]